VSYRIESKVQGDTAQGREQSYALPRATVRVLSVVPDDATDIREAAATQFNGIENRDSRANLLQTIAGVLFSLAGVTVVVMLISMLRRKKPLAKSAAAQTPARTILGAVAKELNAVQAASRGGCSTCCEGRIGR